MSQERRSSLAATSAAGLLSTLVGAVGGWIAYSTFGIDHHMTLPDAIDAPRERFTGGRSRFVSYYVDTTAGGRPLVLVHSINAAASAYEMRPLFDHYRQTRSVYAIDLPGFGFSERANRVYSPMLYMDAIIDLLERIGEPADVIALSLGSEFAASAALERPDLFHSLTLISPSGFNDRRANASQSASRSGTSDKLHALFSFPLWSQAFYDLLATRKSIHYFLQKSFEGEVDPGLEQYGYLSTHQPGARYAPLYFVSGKLFTPTIREDVYERLTIPVLVLFDRDSFVRFDMLPETLARHDNWRAVRIAPTKGLPQFERLPDVTGALNNFWTELAPSRVGASNGGANRS